MKKIFLLTIELILVNSIIFCQNVVDPSPMMFTFKDANGDSQTTYINHSYFPQKKFLLGWQWGDDPRISYEISSNMSMGSEDMANYHPWGNQPFFNLVTQTSFMLDNAASFQYEPTLLIPKGKEEEFNTNNIANSIFGAGKAG